MRTCDSCGAPVTWATTEARPDKPASRIPLDHLPHADGQYFLRQDHDGTLTAVHVPTLDRAASPHQLHRTHFETCPHAGRHRRGRR